MKVWPMNVAVIQHCRRSTSCGVGIAIAGAVAGPIVILTDLDAATAAPAITSAIGSIQTFDLYTFFASALDNPATLTLTAYLGGSVVASQSFSLGPDGPTYCQLNANFTGVDAIRFAPGNPAQFPQITVVMDSLSMQLGAFPSPPPSPPPPPRPPPAPPAPPPGSDCQLLTFEDVDLGGGSFVGFGNTGSPYHGLYFTGSWSVDEAAISREILTCNCAQ